MNNYEDKRHVVMNILVCSHKKSHYIEKYCNARVMMTDLIMAIVVVTT